MSLTDAVSPQGIWLHKNETSDGIASNNKQIVSPEFKRISDLFSNTFAFVHNVQLQSNRFFQYLYYELEID